ncbi:MAG: GNAT family N-acetyltransferase [Candidatus Eremiobacteraeota bacterium]|nr:GNAT family N-acetyltransferase [Candidatus Eremiobacteraeota bacterium]
MIERWDPSEAARLSNFLASLPVEDLALRLCSHGVREPAARLFHHLTVEHPRPTYIAEEEGRIVGVADLSVDKTVAEIGVIVSPQRRRRYVGSELLRHLASDAGRERIPMLVGYLLRENAPGLALLRSLGFKIAAFDGPTLEATLPL